MGRRRDEATLDQLADLNKYVKVQRLESLEGMDFAAYNIVVACDQPQDKCVAWNAAARAAGAAFVLADVAGATARVFVDFGDSHHVLDADGENPRVAIISGMVPVEGGALKVFCDGRSRLHDGDYVTFKEVSGASQLNEAGPLPITDVSFDTTSFHIPADKVPAGLGAYEGPGGIATQTKVPQQKTFKSLADSLDTPFPADAQGGIAIVDFSKMGRSYTLHAAYQGLAAYASAHPDAPLPPPHDAAAMAEVLAATTAFVKAQQGKEDVVQQWTETAWQPPPDVDAEVVESTARYAGVQLPGLSAFVGGVAAQEIVKLTGKYTPLRQWLYWDVFEALPKPEPAATFAPTGDRYEFSHVLFGADITKRVREQRVFLVGAGALGCEYLKSFAQAGVGTLGKGKITVTDMDNIETSNLNRQFLFRNKDVGQPKSVCGAAAAQAMNPDLQGRVVALEERVGADTEDFFDDAFWGEVDLVVNALDNVPARQYMDSRCVWYEKSLLESGTLGTKGNTMPIIARLTKTYNDTQDVKGDAIPMCTLKNFPFQIEHCIEWARDQFEGMFTQSIAEARSFASDPAAWIAEWEAEMAKLGPGSARTKAAAMLPVLSACKTATWEKCVHLARSKFEVVFADRIKQLTHNFPEDKRTANGALFWSGKRRFPAPAAFDASEPLHCAYVSHGAALLANCFGVPLPADWNNPEALGKACATLDLPEWAPKKEVIKTDEDGDDVKEGAADDESVVQQQAKQLAELAAGDAASLTSLAEKLTPEEFEKDDDSNHHIDFITAASNLRALNYRIDVLSRHETKVIAGKITPAIATTTCAVTGLNMVEFYKLVQFNAGVGIERKVEVTRECNFNLAISQYTLFEAAPNAKELSREDEVTLSDYRCVPEGFTKWDKLEVPVGATDLSLQGVFDYVVGWAAEKSLTDSPDKPDLDSFEAGDCKPFLLGSQGKVFFDAGTESTHARMSRNVFELYHELVEEKGGPKLQGDCLVMHSFGITTEGGDDILVPTVVVKKPGTGAGTAAE